MGIKLTLSQVIERKRPESRLTPIDFDGYFFYPNSHPARALKCKCKCGKTVRVRLFHFLRGTLLSCGCKHHDNLILRNTKYSQHHKQISHVYHAMMSRCYSKKNEQFPNYGGRGVIVCEEWKNNYQPFLDWAIDKWKAGYDLDKDILGDGKLYSPETCCFIPKRVNRGYTRRTHRIEFEGEIISKDELCKRKGIDPTTVNSRIERGWSFEDAINLPLRKNQYQ